MKIQVLFGSPNDERVFGPLCRHLEAVAEVQMEVASAHRHPQRVRDVVTESKADLFVAGAGLAAHLPGVVASLTTKPVIGIAVNGAFSGLDAFLSIAQMPKDIPVMGVTEEQALSLATYVEKIKKWTSRELKISWNPYKSEHPLMAKTLQDLRERSGGDLKWCDPQDPECQGELVFFGERPQGQNLCLYICDKTDLSLPQTALHYFEIARSAGYWVGVNNVTNFLLQIKKFKGLNS